MTEPQNLKDAAGDTDTPPADLLEGLAHDGPLDGGTMTSRRPAGVILVDRPAGLCWLYEWRDGAFYARTTEGHPLVRGEDAPDNLERAAAEGQWDVQAAPWLGGDPNEVNPDAELVDQVDAGAGAELEQPAELGREVTGPINEGV